jgi:hypothetical protein
MVDEVEFTSYYGRLIIKAPVWKTPDLPLHLFLGGLRDVVNPRRAGRPERPAGAIASVGFLIHDLRRPEPFLHMLRVFKPTSALSMGSYILSPFSGAAGATAPVELLGWFPQLKRFGGVVSALFGGPMATFTAVLLVNTAVPAWHEPHQELPFVFAGSTLAAGGGLPMVFTAVAEAGPSRKAAVVGAAVELAAMHRVENEHAILSEPFTRVAPA